MAKVALLNDIHFGMRNSSQIFAKHAQRFYDEIFFPYLEQNNIKHCVILGDVYDVRKSVNVLTAQLANEQFFSRFPKLGIELHCFSGNHDAFYISNLEVTTLRALYGNREYPGMKLYDHPAEIEIDKTKILLMPWIASGNYAECMSAMKKTKAEIVMGHFEFSNFEMYKGNFMETGMDRKIVEKFDMVISGHYHHKSSQNNIHYLGTQFEITWADFDDQKGFHIFDTDTRELEFIKNPIKIFKKAYYNDLNKTFEEIMEEFDPKEYENCYVKLIVSNKQNPYWFDLFFEKLEKSGLVNLHIVDETLSLYTEFRDEEGSLEDTLTILNKYIDGLDIDAKDSVEELMKSLYDEAIHLVEER
jgi:UDP-2,3-diacylglucosamine pyrophosphatase LpxH